MRELRIAREVSCTSSGSVAAQWRLSGEKGRISRTAGLLSDVKGFIFLSIDPSQCEVMQASCCKCVGGGGVPLIAVSCLSMVLCVTNGDLGDTSGELSMGPNKH